MRNKSGLKKLSVLLILIFLSTIMTPMLTTREDPKVYAAKRIKISDSSVSILRGHTKQLEILGTKKKIHWSSSNKKIVTVSSSGTITAVTTGKATITAKVNKKKYQCKVTVKPFKDCKYTTSTGFSFRLPKAWVTDESATEDITYFLAEPVKSSASVFKVIFQEVSDTSNMTRKEYIDFVKQKLKKGTFTKSYSKKLKVNLKVASFEQTSKVEDGNTYVYTTYQFNALGTRMFTMWICDCYAEDYLYEATGIQFADDKVDMRSVFHYFVDTLKLEESV